MTDGHTPDSPRRELDFQQLLILETLLREKSLTRAAQALDMTQPTLSKVLARLRTYFDDPLFVRVGQGMQPTPRAAALAEPVAQILAGMRQLRADRTGFDPASSTRQFSFYMIDGAVVFLLPRLLRYLQQAAPRVRVRAVQCDVRHLDLWLESGVVDCAIGSFPSLVNDVHRQPLGSDSYATLVRSGHPRIDGNLGMEQFVREEHALVTSVGTGHDYASAERVLEATIPSHNVVCRVPTFTGAAHIVKHSDALATLPRRLARHLAADLGLQVLDAPLPLPPLELGQYWHARYHRDPANQWLRNVFRELYQD